jgi:glycerate dehydrogenase
MTRPPRITILDGYTINPGDNPWDPVAALGDLTVFERTGPDQVLERSRDADVILCTKVIFTREILEGLPDLRLLALLATGYNHVDVRAAGELGIPVVNAPGYSTPSVAQFTFALLLALSHRVELHDAAVQGGEWSLNPDFCFWKTPQTELEGRVMGIVGYGDIGGRVGRLAHAFGMGVLAHAPRPKPLPDYSPFSFVSLEELFARSDVVSLHCPLTPENHGFVDQRLLGLMKREAVLLNTARGPLVNARDLADAVREGRIAGAGLDVAPVEPIPPDSPLLGVPNLILTPHIAWASLAARRRLVLQVAENVRAFLHGAPINVVNSREITERAAGEGQRPFSSGESRGTVPVRRAAPEGTEREEAAFMNGHDMGPEERKGRTWAMLSHLSALTLFVGIPFGNLLGPLLVWLLKRNEYPLVDEHGKESLNFQLSMTIYALFAALLIIVLIGIPLLVALAVIDAVLVVIASIKASNGEAYRYPLTIRLIK